MKYIKSFMIAMFLFLSQGCATFFDGKNDILKEVAIQAATLKIIDRAESPEQRAARIFEIANEAILIMEGDVVVSIDYLEEYVRGEIKWKTLDDGDILLINTAISLTRVEIEDRLKDAEIGERFISVQKVFKIVATTAATKI